MRQTFPRWAALGLLGLLAAGASGCLAPVGVDCRLSGACQCVKQADCPVGLDCLDGRCQFLPDASGAFGLPCDAGSECESGWCLPPGRVNGRLCTSPCDAGACPRAWECKQPSDGGLALCAPPSQTLCLPCADDLDCGALGDRCLDVGGQRVCGRDCSVEGCPSGYRCLAGGDGGAAAQCVPVAGTCQCTELSQGLTRPCSAQNDAGVCFGHQVCRAGEWSGCEAKLPSAEVCDGTDNDCDGLVDSDDPSLDVSGLPASPAFPACRKGDGGACVGEWACRAGLDGGFGFSCSAADPSPESCNGRDDDCNGRVDEPFLDSSGRYLDLRHCGSCGFDCLSALPNLAADGGAACEVRGAVPTCVPKACASGHFPSPVGQPITCQKAVGSSCRPCAIDSDCGVFDRCIPLPAEVGTYCAQACDALAPYPGCTGQVGLQGCCPAGSACQAVGSARLCVPNGGSCSCSQASLGSERSCFVGASATSCVGAQSCLSSGWGGCATESVTPELCDGLDNDCDGQVDETFIGTRDSGTYDTDLHCGSCTQNCRALWNPTLQHAVGACDAGPGRPPSCQIAACTREQVPGGGLCQVDADCAPFGVCHPLFHQCVRACASAADCGGRTCREGYCALACTSNLQCSAAFGAPSFCDAGACEVTYQFVNADGDPTNGCECPRAGVRDEPDRYRGYPDGGAPYLDRDCDGVDGTASTSLFVWAGSPQSLGTRANPFRSIGEAMAAFSPASHSAILVAAGRYREQVILRPGLRLYGGYSPDFSRRDVVGLSTLVEAPEPDFTSPNLRRGTVNAEGIRQETVFAGFTVRGYDVTYRPMPGGAGMNSYGVYVKDSSAALVLANNHVVGGRAGDGTPGSPGGAGSFGPRGLDGLDTVECGSANCTGAAQDGGAGGVNPSCAAASGNPGAPAVASANPQAYSPGSALDGVGGSNAFYLRTSGSLLCKNPCYMPGTSMAGGDARNGTDGPPGQAGAGCADPAGSIVLDEWRAAAATPGVGGRPGTGGGGGGAGGCVLNSNTAGCTVGNRVGDLGATGGGGGAGGCGGVAGARGGGGGGSFGIFVVFSAPPSSWPTLEGNLVEVGSGGFGGRGGAGGYGGQGGFGGEGGLTVFPAWCAGKGGHGGRGGNGGAGGGGGGGCGGVALGLAGNFLGGAGYATRNTLLSGASASAGDPGAGGASPAGSSFEGQPGVRGLASTYRGY